MSALRKPRLDEAAIARQGAVLTNLKRPPRHPVQALQAPDVLVEALTARLDGLLEPLERGFARPVDLTVTPTAHPARETALAFDVARGDATVATLYLDRDAVDHLVAAQCGMKQPARRGNVPLTPFETGLASTFLSGCLPAVSRAGDELRLIRREDPVADTDALGDATLTLRSKDRGRPGAVFARARAQLREAGLAAMTGQAIPADNIRHVAASHLVDTPLRLDCSISVPRMPLAAIRGLRVGQTLRLGPDAAATIRAGRRRLARGTLVAGDGVRRIAVTALAPTVEEKT